MEINTLDSASKESTKANLTVRWILNLNPFKETKEMDNMGSTVKWPPMLDCQVQIPRVRNRYILSFREDSTQFSGINYKHLDEHTLLESYT